MGDRLVWTDELHDFLAWTYDLGREHGFYAGWAAADAAMQRAVDEALSPPHGYGLTPAPEGAKDVIARMLRSECRQAISRRAAEVRGVLVPDHRGGPVPAWEVDE